MPISWSGPTPLALFVFDMAGTTIAVADEVPVALQEAFARHDIEVPPEWIRGVRGRSKRDAVRDLVVRVLGDGAASRAKSDDILAAFLGALKVRYSDGVFAIPGAQETLGWLRSRDVPVILTTGFDRELADLLLQRLGWGDDLITGLITADDVLHGRPDPELVLRAMTVAGVVDPAAVAVIGDTTADLEAAARAGAECIIGVLSGAHTREELALYRHATLLDSVADLPGWLEGQLTLRCPGHSATPGCATLPRILTDS